MKSSVETLICLDASPLQVAKGLPNGLIPDYEKGRGFSDKLIVIPTERHEYVALRISYDGESEMIATIEDNPYKYSEDRCTEILRGLFNGPDDEEDEDEG